MSKATSLVTLTEALTQHGWAFEATETEVSVPDYDSSEVVRSRYSGRARWVPTKKISGVVVTAHNRQEAGFEQRKFTAYFTAEGNYLAQQTTGSYPFNLKGYSLKNILHQVEKYDPQVLAERKSQREAEEAESEVKEAEAVLAAHTEAKETLATTKDETVAALMAKTGVEHWQAWAVLEMVEKAEFGPYLTALTEVQRTGEGWLPGKTYVSGTYKDGLPV